MSMVGTIAARNMDGELVHPTDPLVVCVAYPVPGLGRISDESRWRILSFLPLILCIDLLLMPVYVLLV